MNANALSAYTALRKVSNATYRACIHAYQRYYAWKHRPPTPEETAEAQATFLIVLNEITASEKASKVGATPALKHLTTAAYHLRAIRRLDPTVYHVYENDNGTQLKMTVDYLAAEILTHESYAHRQNALVESAKLPDLKREAHRSAMRAAKKAVRLQPHVVPFVLQLARCQGDSWLGKAQMYFTLKRARAIDPDNIDTIRMQREMFRLW